MMQLAFLELELGPVPALVELELELEQVWQQQSTTQAQV
jgi:hypothetical protein